MNKSPYTVVSLTSRDGSSVRPRAKFWSARTAQTNRSIRKGAGLHLGAVQKPMLVRLDMRWIEAVRIHSEREGGS